MSYATQRYTENMTCRYCKGEFEATEDIMRVVWYRADFENQQSVHALCPFCGHKCPIHSVPQIVTDRLKATNTPPSFKDDAKGCLSVVSFVLVCALIGFVIFSVTKHT